MSATQSLRFLLLTTLFLQALPAAAFSFADEEAKDNAPAKRAAPAAVPAACKEKLKNERVLVLVAERGNQGFNTDQERFGSHFMAIDKRLRKQGLRTFTPEEIRKVIAQAEIDAHFRNDPDAAINASKKMGASMTLRGVMSSRRSVNPMLKINEVAVHMSFNLIAADGHLIADAGASSDSYSGSDTASMALTLINEQADGVVNKLIRGYCSDGGK